jgi:large subunit ribosomal protein L24
MNKIRKGDAVIILAGRDKGKRGDVMRVDEDRVTVSGINVVKKTTRPNPMQNQPGGIISKELSIHISNISLVNGAGKADGAKIEMRDGKRVRVFKSAGTLVGA